MKYRNAWSGDTFLDRALYGFAIAWPFILVAATILIIVMVVVDCSDKKACRDRGGVVEEYNKHTIWMPVSCGSGCTVVVPEEVSDWRCVDSISAPATSR